MDDASSVSIVPIATVDCWGGDVTSAVVDSANQTYTKDFICFNALGT